MPLSGIEIVEEGTGGVGGIGGVGITLRQPRHEPAVYGAGRQLTPFRPSSQLRVLPEQPGQLRSGEVGVENEPRALAYGGLVAPFPQLSADPGCSPVLPHDGTVDRLQRLTVPDNDSLPLVGDPHGGHLYSVAAATQRLPGNASGHLPDLHCVVLHPAGAREVLGELGVGSPRDTTVLGNDQRRRPRGALIDGENRGHFAHGSTPSRVGNSFAMESRSPRIVTV